jgi:GTP-binding protein Era
MTPISSACCSMPRPASTRRPTRSSQAREVKHPKILVLNKIDLVPREKLLALAQAANERMKFEHTFMISALSGDGVDDLRATLAAHGAGGAVSLSRGPDVGRADAASGGRDHARERSIASCTRNCRISPRSRPTAGPSARTSSIRIEQTIFVERESQRKIVLGKGGATIKSIGADSRKEIAEIVGVPVHLFLFVKVRENWGDDPERYREMGLEFPKE